MSGGAGSAGAALTPSDEALHTLARSLRVPASQWPGALDGLDQPGLYAWWVDAAGAQELSLGLGMSLPEGLLYVGRAGAASTVNSVGSAATLRSRIGKNHLAGKVSRSTLRRSLAAMLLGPVALALAGPKRLQKESEVRLGAWMQAHLLISVWGTTTGAQLAETEKKVVQELEPPLNLDHIPIDALRRRIRGLRAIVTHGIDDLWVAPDPKLTEWRGILSDYGQAFDGYRYATLVRRRECAEVADEVWRSFEEEPRFTSSFADLRCALFWLQRCVHNAEQSPGWEPGADLEDRVQRLYAAIQEAWRRSDAEL
jgi:hypothetical protein